MPIRQGLWSSETRNRHLLRWEKTRGTALGVAQGAMGQLVDSNLQRMEQTQAQLDAARQRFQRHQDFLRASTVTPHQAMVRFYVEGRQQNPNMLVPPNLEPEVNQALTAWEAFKPTFMKSLAGKRLPETTPPPDTDEGGISGGFSGFAGALKQGFGTLMEGAEEYQKRGVDPTVALYKQATEQAGPFGPLVSPQIAAANLLKGEEATFKSPEQGFVNPFTAIYSGKEQQKVQNEISELDPVTYLALSIALDPANLLPVVGFGPDVRRLVTAAREGGPAGVRAIRAIVQNPKALEEIRLYHGTTAAFEGMPNQTATILGGTKRGSIFASVHPEKASLYAEGTGGRVIPMDLPKDARVLTLIDEPTNPKDIAKIAAAMTPEQAQRFRQLLPKRPQGWQVRRAIDEVFGYGHGNEVMRRAGYDAIKSPIGDYEVINPGILRSAFEPAPQPSLGRRILSEEAGGTLLPGPADKDSESWRGTVEALQKMTDEELQRSLESAQSLLGDTVPRERYSPVGPVGTEGVDVVIPEEQERAIGGWREFANSILEEMDRRGMKPNLKSTELGMVELSPEGEIAFQGRRSYDLPEFPRRPQHYTGIDVPNERMSERDLLDTLRHFDAEITKLDEIVELGRKSAAPEAGLSEEPLRAVSESKLGPHKAKMSEAAMAREHLRYQEFVKANFELQREDYIRELIKRRDLGRGERGGSRFGRLEDELLPPERRAELQRLVDEVAFGNRERSLFEMSDEELTDYAKRIVGDPNISSQEMTQIHEGINREFGRRYADPSTVAHTEVTAERSGLFDYNRYIHTSDEDLKIARSALEAQIEAVDMEIEQSSGLLDKRGIDRLGAEKLKLTNRLIDVSNEISARQGGAKRNRPIDFLGRLLKEERGGTQFGAFLPEPVQGVEAPIPGPPTLPLHEQDEIGEGLTRLSGVPDQFVVPEVRRDLPTIQRFQEQATEARINYNTAKSRLAGLRKLGKDQLASPKAITDAHDLVNAARSANNRAKAALQSARLRFAKQDVIDAALHASGDHTAAQMVGRSFDDMSKILPAEEPLLTAPQWRKQMARVVSAVRGSPVGAIGRIGEQGQTVAEALHRVSQEQNFPVYKRVQQGISKYVDQISYKGPSKYKEIATGPTKPYHIVQHPEWWDGIPASLRNDMNTAQRLMRKRFDFMVSLGYPADALETAYLEQLWDLPRAAIESRVPRARGKVSVTRQRLFADYAEGMSKGFTPRPDMTVQDLMEHSNALLDTAISDAFIRQEVIRRFGSKSKNLRAGVRPFNHPLYSGYNAPEDIVAAVDSLYNPPGGMMRGAQALSGAFKNTVFGALDIATAGVHFPLTIAQGGLQLAVGELNRSLEFMRLPHFVLYMQDPSVASRTAQNASRYRTKLGIGPSSIQLKGGTLVQYIPGIGKHLDRPITAVIDNLARLQFGVILGHMRSRMTEGNAILLKMAGENIDDPATRHLIGDWANSMTGASRGALRPGRRAMESVTLTSFQMARSQMAVLGSIAKGLGPKASKAERLRAAITLANYAAYVYGIQYLVNKQFGNGPMEWVPGKHDWGTIKVGGETVPIVPNASLIRAMERSVEYLASGQEQDIPKAWAQLVTGRVSPLVQAPLAAAGFGFEPGTGSFKTGTLSQKGRLIGGLPIPPLIETAAFESTRPEVLAATAAGFNTYRPSALSQLRDIQQYQMIDNDTVRDIQRDGGFLDRVSDFKSAAIRPGGLTLEQVQSIPNEQVIRLVGEQEGKDEEYITTALILSKPSLKNKLVNPEFLQFVLDHEGELLKQAPWLFDQEMLEFLRVAKENQQ